MKVKALLEITLLVLGISGPLLAQSSKKYRLPDKTYDLAAGKISGDKVRGPRRIIIKNLNTLRYNYTLSRVVSFAGPGDLWSKLLAASAAVAEKPPQQPKGSKAPGALKAPKCNEAKAAILQANDVITAINNKSGALWDIKTKVDESRKELDNLLNDVRTGTGRITEGGHQLTETLRANSTVPDGIIRDVRFLLGQNPKSLFLEGTEANWVDPIKTKSLQAKVADLKKQVEDQKRDFAAFVVEESAAIASAKAALGKALEKQAVKNSDCTQEVDAEIKELEAAKDDLIRSSKLLDWESSELDKVQAALPDLQEGSAKYTAFIQAREALREWKVRMEELLRRWEDYQNAVAHNLDLEQHPDPFSIISYGDCDFAFGGTKSTAITLTPVDQLPGNSTTPEQVLSVAIECTSPFSVSAGVAFSTVLQQEFAIRPTLDTSTGATVNTFVVTSSSRFHPMPLGMVHARFYEPNEALAFHAGFGVAGNIRGQSAGGSDAEFLFGVSLSLFRTMFITPGLHLGRRVGLSSGFTAGDTKHPVPSGITEPPLTKSYRPGFGLAITFTKP